jgi:hypothetical protein
MAKTAIDLFVFGNRNASRAPRIGFDVVPNDEGVILPDFSSLPPGASTFADPRRSGLTGHFHRLPAGTELPEGWQITADGFDVLPESPLPASHHTLHILIPMHADEFVRQFLSLPWQYGGRQ